MCGVEVVCLGVLGRLAAMLARLARASWICKCQVSAVSLFVCYVFFVI